MNIIEVKSDNELDFFCPCCGDQLHGYGSCGTEGFCEHIIFYYDSLAAGLEHIREDIGNIDDHIEYLSDPYRVFDEIAPKIDNKSIIVFKFVDEAPAGMGSIVFVGIEMGTGIKMMSGELTALEVADKTNLAVRSIQRIAPEIVEAGHGRRAGGVYIFYPSAIEYIKNRPEKRGRKKKD